LAALGCGNDSDASSATTAGTGGAGGDDCWYCGDGGGGMAGVGGATGSGITSGKGSSSGKGGGSGDGITFVYAGELNTKTGEGAYSGLYTSDDKTVQCDVSFTITGATLDPSCAACNFAYEMPLSMPMVTLATGCDGFDKLTTTKWGHQDPGTVMFEKGGTYNPIKDGGTSKVEGDVWTFGLVFQFGGGGKN
jgi:hypothetical protein